MVENVEVVEVENLATTRVCGQSEPDLHGFHREMPPPPLSVDDLTHRWLDWLQHNRGRAESTADKYAEVIQRLAHWARKEQDLGLFDLTPNDIADFAGPIAHACGLSPSARRPMVAAIKSFYSYAAQQRACAHLAKDLEYPKVGRLLPVGLSLQDAERMLMAPDIGTFSGLRDATMIAMLFGCGMRVSGLSGLNESALTWTHGKLTVSITEKGGNERLVPVPSEASTLLQAYLAHPTLASIDRSTASGDKVLFISMRSGPIPTHEFHGERRRMTQRGVRCVLQRHGERAGVDRRKVHPHAARHLYGTELAESSVDIIERQTLLGHEDPKSTAIYTHLAARKLREVVDRANPLGKMRNPMLDTLRDIAKAKHGHT